MEDIGGAEGAGGSCCSSAPAGSSCGGGGGGASGADGESVSKTADGDAAFEAYEAAHGRRTPWEGLCGMEGLGEGLKGEKGVDMGSFISGQDTPEGEQAHVCLLARMADHVPTHGPPQRLQYERHLFEWLLSPASGHTPQCHVQTFGPIPLDIDLDVHHFGDSRFENQDSTIPSTRSTPRQARQEDGMSAVDGAVLYEHQSVRTSLEKCGKMVLSLYSLPVSQGRLGMAVHGSSEGRVTYVGAPSLAVEPHRFAIHRLRALNHSLTMDPRVSKSSAEMLAKAEVVRHRHFWGHQEISLAAHAAPPTTHHHSSVTPHSHSGLEAGAKTKVPVVFLDRDGVINTLPTYNTGPHAMHLVPGAAAAIVRLQAAGCKVVVVSSQSCVGKGLVRIGDVNSVMDRMCRLLRDEAHEAQLELQRQLLHHPQHLSALPPAIAACKAQGSLAAAASRSRYDLAQPDVIIYSVRMHVPIYMGWLRLVGSLKL